MAKSFLGRGDLPLGLRNNNPGNLRPGIDWQGATGTQGGFLVFRDIAWGIRAMATDIGNDIRLDGKDTITALITEYAPPSENDTTAYINTVSAKTGIAPNAKLSPTRDTLKRLLRAQMEIELGKPYADYITDSDIDEGLSLMNSGLLSFFRNVTESISASIKQMETGIETKIDQSIAQHPGRVAALSMLSVAMVISGLLLLVVWLYRRK